MTEPFFKLFNIQEIKKEKCEHKPLLSLWNEVGKAQCQDCGKILKAEWKEV